MSLNPSQCETQPAAGLHPAVPSPKNVPIPRSSVEQLAVKIGSRRSARPVGWWQDERPIRFNDLPKHLMPLPNGRRISLATAYRYALSGLKGIRVRRFRSGSAWATTLEELARWTAAVNAVSGGDV